LFDSETALYDEFCHLLGIELSDLGSRVCRRRKKRNQDDRTEKNGFFCGHTTPPVYEFQFAITLKRSMQEGIDLDVVFRDALSLFF
jgi:hypothetical protein